MKFKKTSVFICLISVFILAGNAFGYSGTGAKNYADQYALSFNVNYPLFGSDCTNFVSQALHEGGLVSFDYTGTPQWWCTKDAFGNYNWTGYWSVAQDFYYWLQNDGHGTDKGNWDYNSGTLYPDPHNDSSNIAIGDVISYDMDTNGSKNHSGIMVGTGTDPDSGWTGDLTDQHTTDRYHAIWHLRPYNAYWSTTLITAIRPN